MQLFLRIVSLTDSDAELVGAGGGTAAAGIAFELSLDLLDRHAVNELGDSFEVAVAAADE